MQDGSPFVSFLLSSYSHPHIPAHISIQHGRDYHAQDEESSDVLSGYDNSDRWLMEYDNDIPYDEADLENYSIHDPSVFAGEHLYNQCMWDSH